MSSNRRTLLVLMAAFWVTVMNRGVQASHVCEDACVGASCDAECWTTQFEYDNEYPSTTCGAQSYSCCGDGVCDTGTEYCSSCQDDCGTSPSCDTECTWTFQCGGGLVCNSSHQCVVPTPNLGGYNSSCANKTDCQGNTVCAEVDCAIPNNNYCPGSPSCQYTPCPGGQYCDPAIVRCQYVNGTGCPS